jgi:hypothetical protein
VGKFMYAESDDQDEDSADDGWGVEIQHKTIITWVV